MAKTTFVNGTIVQPPFLNGVFSHVHDGADSDGHVSKINLDAGAHVAGQLPLTNVATISASAVVDNSQFNQTNVAGALNLTKSALDNISGDKVEVTGVMKLRGFASDLDVNFYAQIHRHRTSTSILTEVVLHLPEVVGTSTATYLEILGTSIPETLRPSYSSQYVFAEVVDDQGGSGGPIPGTLQVLSSGNWFLRKYSGSSFAQANEKGIVRQMLRYLKSIEAV